MNKFLRHTARRMQDILCTLHIPLKHVSMDCGIFLVFSGGLQAARPPLPLQCRPGARRYASQFLMNFQNMEACGSGKSLRSPGFLCHIGVQKSQKPHWVPSFLKKARFFKLDSWVVYILIDKCEKKERIQVQGPHFFLPI